MWSLTSLLAGEHPPYVVYAGRWAWEGDSRSVAVEIICWYIFPLRNSFCYSTSIFCFKQKKKNLQNRLIYLRPIISCQSFSLSIMLDHTQAHVRISFVWTNNRFNQFKGARNKKKRPVVTTRIFSLFSIMLQDVNILTNLASKSHL